MVEFVFMDERGTRWGRNMGASRLKLTRPQGGSSPGLFGGREGKLGGRERERESGLGIKTDLAERERERDGGRGVWRE